MRTSNGLGSSPALSWVNQYTTKILMEDLEKFLDEGKLQWKKVCTEIMG